MKFSNLKKKNIGARALPRARRIFASQAKKQHIFDFSAKIGFARAPRAEVRARPKFFVIWKIHKKSLCNFFLLSISQKLTILAQFEVSAQYWKNRYFWQKFEKNRKFSQKVHFGAKSAFFKNIDFFNIVQKLQIVLKSSMFWDIEKKFAQRFFMNFSDNKKF